MEQMLENLLNKLQNKFGGEFAFVDHPRGVGLNNNGEPTGLVLPIGQMQEAIDRQETTWQDIEDLVWRTWELTMEMRI